MDPFPHLKRATRLLFAAREGSVFSLGLRGRVAEVAGGVLRLTATSVRSYPGGGRWLAVDPRQLDIAVSEDSTVQSRLPRAAQEQPLRVTELGNQTRVAVFTAKARVTKAALIGAPGTLTASRVSSLVP